MPDGLTWNDYVKQVNDRVIAVGEGIVRKTLGDMVVKIRYTGIYENEIQTTERKLDWFKRHFE